MKKVWPARSDRPVFDPIRDPLADVELTRMPEPAPTSAAAGQAAGTGLAVLGIDPGSRWTAGVLRYGAAALYGWDGQPS